MLVFVAIAGIVGFVQTTVNKPKLVSHLPAPSHPLRKPEPEGLLARSDLGLTSNQRSAIQAIDTSWSNDKAKLLKAMSAFEPKEGRADQISGSLEGYSDLSRTYDATRTRYWTLAKAQLDKQQQILADGGSK